MIEEGDVIGVEYPRSDVESDISTVVLLIHAAASLALIVTSWLITVAFAIISPMLSDGCGGSATPDLLCSGGFIGLLVVSGLLGPGLVGLPLWVTGLVKKRPKWLWFGALAALLVLAAWVGTVVLVIEA